MFYLIIYYYVYQSALSGQLDIKRYNYTRKVMDTTVISDCYGNIQCRPSVDQHCRRVGQRGGFNRCTLHLYLYCRRLTDRGKNNVYRSPGGIDHCHHGGNGMRPLPFAMHSRSCRSAVDSSFVLLFLVVGLHLGSCDGWYNNNKHGFSEAFFAIVAAEPLR